MRTLHLPLHGQLISLGCPGPAACRFVGRRSFHGVLRVLLDPRPVGGFVKKDDREIMNILEAFDLTGFAHSAAQLAGCDPKTVRHWVAQRDRGLPVGGPGRRERLIDPFLGKVEEWVDRSKGHVRADVVHERLVAVGFDGDERITRRAVAEAKARWRVGHQRTYRPWVC
jgi:hypothetical protein